MDFRIWGKSQQLEIGGMWFRQGIWSKLEHEGREVDNVSGIKLTSFYHIHRLTVGVGDAMDRTSSWKYSVFCRQLPESTG